MSQNTSQRRKNNCVSEIKSKENIKCHKDLITLLDKNAENKNHTMCFYLIKFFIDKKIHSISSNILLTHILNIFRKYPENLITKTDEVFKNERSIKTTFTKLINKNIIFEYVANEKKYKLNEKKALKYLRTIYYFNNSKDYKTPMKYGTKSKKLQREERENNLNTLVRPIFKIKKEENEDENIMVKKEKVIIKEEEKEGKSEERVQIKKEELSIKEESKIKEEDIYTDDDEFQFDTIIELFKGKLYNDFFQSFSEQGLYEQLQEKVEKLLEKIQNSSDVNNSVNNVNNNTDQNEFIIKIKRLQASLNELNKNKEKYVQLILDFENKKKNLILYIKLLKFKKHVIKLAKEIISNDELSNCNMVKEAKAIYDYDKKRHDFVYEQLINSFNELKTHFKNSVQNKNNIKNEFIDFVEKNFINLENPSEFCELKDNFKNENYSSIDKEDIITEKIFQKYNKLLTEFDDKMKLNSDSK